jgi:drug/metabolite transporter superfamily protein YnfA
MPGMQSASLRLALGLLVLIVAAGFEVAGDAVIRRGLRGGGILTAALGCLLLATYGITVNLLKQDFSRTLGTYVGVFAVTSVLAGKLFFGDRIGGASWLGLGVIVVGCLIIQFGTLPR